MSAGMRLAAPAFIAALLSVVLHAQDAQRLPDFDSLYKTVRDNLTKSERVAHLYAFKERRTDIHTNPFGKIGTDGTRVLEVYPSSERRLTYRRVVERNGTRLSASEIAEQDREYRDRVTEFRQQAAQNTQDDRRGGDNAARARTRGQQRIEDIVNALQFTLTGRAMRNGVPAYVITFTPRPTARPSTREGRIAQKFTGTVWVHEKVLEVIEVEAKAIEDISFGLGIIARLGEGTSARLTRRPIDGDIWMPTELTLNGRGRAALLRRLVIDYSVQWFDYRRLPGNSLAPFVDSTQ
jgi:hypothetical protein